MGRFLSVSHATPVREQYAMTVFVSMSSERGFVTYLIGQDQTVVVRWIAFFDHSFRM